MNTPLLEFQNAGWFLWDVSVDFRRCEHAEDVITEYEHRFMEKGQPIYRAVWKKKMKEECIIYEKMFCFSKMIDIIKYRFYQYKELDSMKEYMKEIHSLEEFEAAAQIKFKRFCIFCELVSDCHFITPFMPELLPNISKSLFIMLIAIHVWIFVYNYKLSGIPSFVAY